MELHGKGMYVDVTATPPFDDLRLPPLACHGKKSKTRARLNFRKKVYLRCEK